VDVEVFAVCDQIIHTGVLEKPSLTF
jgi:hypothetical protein